MFKIFVVATCVIGLSLILNKQVLANQANAQIEEVQEQAELNAKSGQLEVHEEGDIWAYPNGNKVLIVEKRVDGYLMVTSVYLVKIIDTTELTKVASATDDDYASSLAKFAKKEK